MKKLPKGIQNISEILENDYIYVDKTALAHKLISTGKHYFMSRPRRFGKSLFVSTLDEIFRGNKELFKSCEIYKKDYDWQNYPVLHFDFSRIPSRQLDQFEEVFKRTLSNLAKQNGLSIQTPTIEEGLEALITKLSQKGKVVILVDEYDKPIIDQLHNIPIAKSNRDVLKAVFTTLKSLDAHIKFTFITGVTKFSQVSLFSGPNYLTDITMNPSYASIMGYTEEEVRECFAPYLDQIAAKDPLCTTENILDEVRSWYNGYRFTMSVDSVYNPFSTLNYMDTGQPESYWYRTGTPSFLIEQIKTRPQSLIPLSGVTALKNTLADINNFENINLTALMFQTGYLTITGHDAKNDIYSLDFPNREVRQAFFNSLLEDFAHIDPTTVVKSSESVQNHLKNCEIKPFVNIMNAHFAKIPYQLFEKTKESFYHAIFLTFLERSEIKVSAEIPTNIGRIDLKAEFSDIVYIFELKLDQTADIAFDQAHTLKYKEQNTHSDQNIAVIGINFSSTSRNISDYKGKLFSSSGKLIKDL